MVAKKKAKVSTETFAEASEIAKEAKEINEVVKENLPVEPELPEADQIKANIDALKLAASKVNTLEAAKGLLTQLKAEPNSFERGEPIESCAARVMASQATGTVTERLVAIAKTRNALKKQGYGMVEREAIMDKIEEAYEL